jgi:hypothetical protein
LHCFTTFHGVTASCASGAEVKVQQNALAGFNDKSGLRPFKWIRHKLRVLFVESGYLLDVFGIIIFAVADLMTVCLIAVCVENAFYLRYESRTLLSLLNTSERLHTDRNLP